MQHRTCVVLAGLLLSVGLARADVLAVEDFEDYAVGAFANGAAGGTGWGGGWIVPGAVSPTVVAGGLSYSGGAIAVDGGSQRLRQDVPATQSGAFFPAMRALATDQTGTLYMSLLVRPDDVEDDDFYQFGLSDTNNNPEGSVLIDRMNSTDYLVRAGTAGGSSLGAAATNDVTVLLVLKVEKLSSNYTVTGFLNPTSLTEADNPSVVAGAAASYSQVSYWVFRAARIETTDEIEIDRIRIATTFSEAIVPEPATAALLMLGTLPLLRRRRR